MLRASYWQFERHQSKLAYIQTLESRLKSPIAKFTEIIPDSSNTYSPAAWHDAIHRRVEINGEFDFAHEIILRNRRFDGFPGVHVLTPLRLEGTDIFLLVSRGFLPLALSTPEKRAKYHQPSVSKFIGLVKESSPRKFLAPQDPPAGLDLPWVDAWLRVDIQSIEKQLPYRLIPVYVEIMQSAEIEGLEERIVSSKSGRDEMLVLPGKESSIRSDREIPNLAYPVPVFDTVIPPGRHKGYIFEWAGMAVLTLLIGLVLQLRRPSGNNK